MSSKTINVLIEGGGTATAMSVLKGISLVKNEYPIKTIVTDIDPVNAGRYIADKYFQVPSSKSPDYIDKVIEISQKEKIHLYIPIIDYGFKKLAKNKKVFSKIGTKLVLAPASSIELISDKFTTYKHFKEISVPTPKTYTYEQVKKTMKFPLIIKPRTDGRASLGVYYIQNFKDYQFHTENNTNIIGQEILSGQEFTADCLSTLDGSRFINAVIRRRLETKGGVSIKADVISGNQELKIKKYLKIITESLEIPGACNIQGYIEEDQNIYFTEINPRFAGTHAFTIAVGLNSIKYIIDMYKGISSQNISKMIRLNTQIKMIRYWTEIFVENNTASSWKTLVSKTL